MKIIGKQIRRGLHLCVAYYLLAWAGPFFVHCVQGQGDEPVIGRVVAWGSNTLGQTNLPAGLTNVIAIAAGSVHSVALKSDGTVCAWGGGHSGETNVPPGLSNVVAIATAGFYGNNYGYSLALKRDGTVSGWGAVNLPPDLSNIVAVAAGAYWWMALKSDGTVTGNYPYLRNGLLALGDIPLSNVVAIASGDRHCLALTRDGTVVGWGVNGDGRATGVPSGGSSYTNGLVTHNGQALSNVVAIAAGSSHSVALQGDGTVIVWGSTNSGQANVPTGLSQVVALAPGGNEWASQVLAVQADGQLAAWGGSNAQTNVPAGLTNVVAAAVGSAHSLALLGAGPLRPHASLSAPAWEANSVRLALPTQSGRVYALEYKQSLHESDWLPASLTAGNGHLGTLLHANPASSTSFYRARQW